MSELEARIIASTSAQAAPEEAIAAESCAGASAQEDRCVGASNRVTLLPDRIFAARKRHLRRLMQLHCCRASVRRVRSQGKS